MTVAAIALSLLIAGIGGLGLAAPAKLLDLVRRFQTPRGIYVAAGFRLLFGVVLLLAAPESRAPGVLRILGFFVIVAGLATPLFGRERFRKLLDWFVSMGDGFVRSWSLFAFGFGVALAWALVP